MPSGRIGMRQKQGGHWRWVALIVLIAIVVVVLGSI